MKKLLLAIIFTNSLMSELVIEITQGTDDPFKVALVQFGGNTEISEELSQIIKVDLKRSGEFNVFDENNLLSVPSNESEIVFNDFRILNIDFLIMGKVIEDGMNISVEYQVYDIKKASKALSLIHI